jgi:argininosuccinate synthase
VADLPEDVKHQLRDLARFSGALPQQDIVKSKEMLPNSTEQRKPIESFEDIEKFEKRDAPVVTMFSGGLDSTYLLFRLQRLGFTNIHAVAVDVGAPIDEDALTKYTANFGATFKCLNGRQLFVKECVIPAIRAQAKYIGMYPISSSLSRPVIAHLITDYAKSVNAGLLLHTANLSQNSLPRLNNSIRRYGFPGEFGSPYVYSVVSREMKAKELAEFGLTVMTERKLSGDENLWCREFESGPLDDPESFTIPEDAYQWTRHWKDYMPEKLTLGFEKGSLISVNDTQLPLIKAISLLNQAVGKFGHGRYVGLEPIRNDHKVLEVREAPAATIIMDALRHLEVATLDTNTLDLKQNLEQKWVLEAITGRWGSSCHSMCDAAIASTLNNVSGSVTYVIDHTRYLPCSIVAKNPRYIRDRDQWEQEESLRIFRT